MSILELKLSRINRTQTWLCFLSHSCHVESVFVGGFTSFGSNYKMHTGAWVISNACSAPLRNGNSSTLYSRYFPSPFTLTAEAQFLAFVSHLLIVG